MHDSIEVHRCVSVYDEKDRYWSRSQQDAFNFTRCFDLAVDLHQL